MTTDFYPTYKRYEAQGMPDMVFTGFDEMKHHLDVNRPMGLLNDQEISRMAKRGMISPFVEDTVRENEKGQRVLSYGLSSYGYDIRLGEELKIFVNANQGRKIDPKKIDDRIFTTVQSFRGPFELPPYSYALGYSEEIFNLPEDIFCIVLGKSTYARCGIIINVTPGEPGWYGQWTLEFANTTPLPALVYPYEGIAQCIFFRGSKPGLGYGDRSGKYNDQSGIVLPKV